MKTGKTIKTYKCKEKGGTVNLPFMQLIFGKFCPVKSHKMNFHKEISRGIGVSLEPDLIKTLLSASNFMLKYIEKDSDEKIAAL